MSRSNPTRRRFLIGAAAGVGVAAMPAFAARRTATDLVPLGNSGVKVTRLAFGTGTFGGRIQRELGQAEFTKLVRYAYERGIRFFETADSYRGMPQMLAEALKGLPRDSYQLMTKMRWRGETDPRATIDRFRRELNSEYFDVLLMHCVRTPGWRTELAPIQDAFREAKHREILRSHGASCHGLLPLRAFPDNPWLDVALLRINHDGTRMDTLQSESNEPGDVPRVTGTISRVHAQGTGVIGMKLIGEGQFTTPERRDAALEYVMRLGTVDAVTIGFKSTAEIDEAIERINTHLNS
jgi:aryl-alcohol dehydrogenase-like predicted oxidoreductase